VDDDEGNEGGPWGEIYLQRVATEIITLADVICHTLEVDQEVDRN
jgi:hypothetical protein